MKLNELTKIKTRSKKRIGRGIGSGKGKTSARGSKGQKSREKIPLRFTGDVSFYRKLPLRKGQGNPKISSKPKIVHLSKLNVFPKGSKIDLEQLIKAKVVNEKDVKSGIKILLKGKLEKALIVKLPVSKNVKKAIEKIGGKVDV
ncbi:MAG: 50S ribosomal protein L15 [Candidatus Daviesbacteria bacterium]|nr:50S ribosomal protein L15 [Candidatus Daviesbacteria bacterium]